MTEEYPSNSQRRRAPAAEKKEPAKKRVQAITTSQVVRRKKPLSKRFAETFTGEDSKGVLDYVVFDVAVPAAKDMFFDIITQATERKLFGEVRSRSRRGTSWVNPTHTAYRDVSRKLRDERPTMSRRGRAQHDFDEIILGTRAEAEAVLTSLDAVIEQFEFATVRDLYDLVDLPANFTDEKYGWTNLGNASTTRAGGGYLLNLPRPEPID